MHLQKDYLVLKYCISNILFLFKRIPYLWYHFAMYCFVIWSVLFDIFDKVTTRLFFLSLWVSTVCICSWHVWFLLAFVISGICFVVTFINYMYLPFYTLGFGFTLINWQTKRLQRWADPAILKRGVPTICPHSNALIVQKKGGPTPGTLTLDPPLQPILYIGVSSL